MPIATILGLAASCAPGVSPVLIAQIAQTESHLDPLAIHDNTARRSYAPADSDIALAVYRELVGAGHSVDGGLMQINSRNLRWTGLAITDVFDPCASIRAGAQVLTALSRYNTGSSKSPVGMAYAVRVLSQQQKGGEMRLPPAVPEVTIHINPFVRPAPTPRALVFNTGGG